MKAPMAANYSLDPQLFDQQREENLIFESFGFCKSPITTNKLEQDSPQIKESEIISLLDSSLENEFNLT